MDSSEMDASEMCDTSLVRKAVEGDHAAFENLVGKYRGKLHRVLFLMLQHEEDARDLSQDALIKAYQALHHLKKPELFCNWLFKIAMNLAINHIKKRDRNRRHCQRIAEDLRRTQKVESPDSIVERQELADRLQGWVAELPPKQRSVFVLCDVEGCSYREISEILHCRMGTVMSRLYYARNFLRNRLQASGMAPGSKVPPGSSEGSEFLAADPEKSAQRKLP